MSDTLTALVLVLSAFSALPDRECMEWVGAAFERGLGYKVALGRSFEGAGWCVLRLAAG